MDIYSRAIGSYDPIAFTFYDYLKKTLPFLLQVFLFALILIVSKTTTKQTSENEMKIKIEIEITEQQISNWLITALEQGNNWAKLDHKISKYESTMNPFTEGYSLVIRDENNGVLGKVTLNKIKKGIKKFISENPKHLKDFLAYGGDSIVADMALQYVLFGKVVYC